MSDYEAYSARQAKVSEILERVRKQDDEEDDVDYFQKKRIQRDAIRERQKEVERSFQKREKEQREQMGSSAWSDKKDEELKRKIEKNRQFDVNQAEEDLRKRREERELRREDRRALAKRQDEMRELKLKWELEDKARSVARAEEENYRRGQEWRRQESKLAAVKRERETFREERRLREEEKAVHHHIRDREWEIQQDQQAFDAKEWAKVQEKKKKKEDRAIIKAALGVDKHDTDPYAESVYRETERRKKNWDGYKRRLGESELQFDELKKWYTNRSLERAERTRRDATSTTL